MDAIRIKNLRSLLDSGYIELRPLTIAVGENNSGKSSFIRVLPLLRQSIETRTTGPILWNGRFVDYGTFDNAISKLATTHGSASASEVTFGFKFTIRGGGYASGEDVLMFFDPDDPISVEFIDDTQVTLEFDVASDATGVGSITRELRMWFNDHSLTVTFSDSGKVDLFKVNNEVFTGFVKDMYGVTGRTELVPQLLREAIPQDADNPETVEQKPQLLAELENAIYKHLNKNAKKDAVARIAAAFRFGASELMLKNMQQISVGPRSWISNTKNWTIQTREFTRVKNLTIACALEGLISLTGSNISDFIFNTSYIGPIRASAERYYRAQNLDVDDVDYQGRNLHMFIRNLSTYEQDAFSSWCAEHFEIYPIITSESGLMSVELKQKDSGTQFNIADTGFGYSQVLPILAQLWTVTRRSHVNINTRSRLRRRRKSEITFVMEQPELHLHPRMQAKLADTLIAATKIAREGGINLKLLIETHSEAIINRIGTAISEREYPHEDTSILLFTKLSPDAATIIDKSTYDSEGYLTNWPLGFFDSSRSK